MPQRNDEAFTSLLKVLFLFFSHEHIHTLFVIETAIYFDNYFTSVILYFIMDVWRTSTSFDDDDDVLAVRCF